MGQTDLSTDPLLEKAPIHEGYKVLGGVVLYQKLGQGGMGAVYRGKHLRLGVDMALKVLVRVSTDGGRWAPRCSLEHRSQLLRGETTPASGLGQSSRLSL